MNEGWARLWQAVREAMVARKAHAARTVVLLPFFQLQALARLTWGQSLQGSTACGFLPRMETTQSWQQRLRPFEPGALDIGFDAGLDSLRARRFLAQAGLQGDAALLTPWLVEAAQQIGGLAACVLPSERAAWADKLRGELLAGSQPQFARHEAAVAQMALAWGAASSYASDVLFEPSTVAQVDLLVVVRGVHSNALTQKLAAHCEAIKPGVVFWQDLPQAATGQLFTQAAQDAEDEAERACACIWQALREGLQPVALPAIDRQTTRRISAMLSEAGVSIADETGWRLSTTRSAAALMSLLRAAHPLATLDEQLDWLKHCDASEGAVAGWEQALRGQNATFAGMESAQNAIIFIASEQSPEVVRNSLRAHRRLLEWLTALRTALQACGQWASLTQDTAGIEVIHALHLNRTELSDIVTSDALRMSLSEFTRWVQAALEGASFKPTSALKEGEAAQVVILPLAQMAARPFACAVLAGTDETRLPFAPELPGFWTRAQRLALGLPMHEQLGAEQQDAWHRAMQLPAVHVLWRSAQGDEPISPSPLLQAWLLQHSAMQSNDARESVSVQAQPQSRPAPSAAALATHVFSASSYVDVRTCPYRYFALRLLGLQEAAELDEELSKREFGQWLHEVLSEFHRGRPRESSAGQDRELLDACAARLAQPFAQEAGFVPFAASWPQLRDSYLAWLSKHEEKGWRFEASELSLSRDISGGVNEVKLQGRLDRMDLLAGSGASQRWVMDYKTESEATLKKRVIQPLEDTQLVFYAALLGADRAGDEVQASYIAITEKTTKAVTQEKLRDALPVLLDGLAHDAQRMLSGYALPALGEGKACEYCAARGLCRKDGWAT
ncbi:MAG: PD-(D/E)XK nuclease family protein [Brachymonas sp.]